MQEVQVQSLVMEGTKTLHVAWSGQKQKRNSIKEFLWFAMQTLVSLILQM